MLIETQWNVWKWWDKLLCSPADVLARLQCDRHFGLRINDRGAAHVALVSVRGKRRSIGCHAAIRAIAKPIRSTGTSAFRFRKRAIMSDALLENMQVSSARFDNGSRPLIDADVSRGS